MMIKILLPDGGEHVMSVDDSLTAESVVRACVPSGNCSDYSLVILGRKMLPKQKLVDIVPNAPQHAFRLVRHHNSTSTLEHGPSGAISITKVVEQCRKIYANLGEELQQQLFVYADNEEHFKKILDQHPNIFYDSLSLSAVKDFRLLVPFVLQNDDFPQQHPHCALILKKALEKVATKYRASSSGLFNGYPAMPIAGTSNIPQHASEAAVQPITQQMLSNALSLALGGVTHTPAAPPPQLQPDSNEPQQTSPSDIFSTALTQQKSLYAAQLATMHEFGFIDDAENVQALILADGNVDQALQIVIATRE